MPMIIAMALLTALGALAADRLGFLKNRPWAQGIWFGALAVIANTFAGDVTGLNIPVGLRDAPVMTAGFFFGPSAGLIAGIIASVQRAITPLWGAGLNNWLSGALITFIIAGYGAGLSKWVFDGKRPPVVTAAIAAAFGEILHLSLNFCLGCRHLAQVLETIYAGAIPMSAGAGLTAGLSAFACGSWRGWRNNFYSSLTLVFLGFGIAFGTIAVTAVRNAIWQTEAALTHAVKKLEDNADTEIGYMLHCNAVSIADNIGTSRPLSQAKMQQIAEDYDVDELNIFDRTGRLLASNSPKVTEFNRHTRPGGPLVRYFELLNGTRKFVKEKQFRRNRSDRTVHTKYIGVPMPDGKAFLQLGYTWKRFEKEFETFFFPLLAEAGFGETGYYLITSASGRVKVAVRNHPGSLGKTLTEQGFRARNLNEPAGFSFHDRINGVWCRAVRCKNVGKWRIYAVQPLAEYHGPAALTVIVAGLTLFAMCVVFRMLILKIRRSRQRIDAMREAEEKRQEEELELARRIQLSQLREGSSETAACKVCAVMTPAREVGGDFYDYYELPDGRLVLTVADVSGKGIPAAFFMMNAKTTIKSSIFRSSSPAEAAAMANRRLNRHNDAFMFVTAWIGIFDPETGSLEYVSAGHNPPLVRPAGGTAEWLDSKRCPALAAFPGARYTGEKTQLRPGDTLFVYTDGVTEAMDPAGELFGNGRLISALNQASEPLIPAVENTLKQFIAGAAQTDDLTMLTLEYKRK